MSAFLVADIGGSKSRFALANSHGEPQRVSVIENDTVADIETALAGYLRMTGAQPQTATLAVAGPIQGEEVALTNRAWRFRRSELAKRFGFSRLRIVNDFEALAWSLPRLTDKHTRTLGICAPRDDGMKLVLGPGTGLGVAALFPAEGRCHAVASEGGHASFGAQAPDEEDAFRRVREQCGAVSAEMVLSGPGLMRLARALHPGRIYRDPESILAQAHSGDPDALGIARMFVRLLGRFAGDLALTFKALGGVYITGGVAAGLASLLDDPQFRTAFEAHPPYQKLLQAIATLHITCEQPGLIGCAALTQMSTASEGPV
jgi:glucokinase